MEKSYGVNIKTEIKTELEYHLENIRIKGFSIMKNILSSSDVELLTQKVENIYEQQEKEIGKKQLEEIKELDMVRAPLAYDSSFLKLLTHFKIKEFVRAILGEYYILHLQNAIINRPQVIHHQTAWHRDLPYQNYVISTPLAVNAFFCLAPFNKETGGTLVLPFSHRLESIPSEKYIKENCIQIKAEAGDVIVFDSMLFHKAGRNTSNMIRIGINNVFSKPILSQQINLPKFLAGKYEDDIDLNVLLGYRFQTPSSVTEFREKRINRLK